jgi:hypothetical protein
MHKKLTPNNRITAPINRRSFVQGLAIGGTMAALNLGGAPVFGETQARTPDTLTGSNFELTIDHLPVNVTTTRHRLATAVNGSVPGPILRWREGDLITLAVTNRLKKEPPYIGTVFVCLQRWMEFLGLVFLGFSLVRRSSIASPYVREERIGITAIAGHRSKLGWPVH